MQLTEYDIELPVKPRRAFVARPGHYILSADFTAEEFYILCSVSGEDTVIDEILNGEDIHISTASRMYGIPQREVTKAQRTGAKCVAEGTRVFTGKGCRKIEDLNLMRVEDKFTPFATEVSSLEGVSYSSFFYYGGVQKVLSITLKNGMNIKVTPNHPLMGGGRWTKAKDLKVGDLLEVGLNNKVYNEKYALSVIYDKEEMFAATEVNEDFGYLYGFYQGGGFNTQLPPPMAKEKMRGVLERLKMTGSQRASDLSYDKRLVDFACLGVNQEEVPYFIWCSPKKVILSYLESLFVMKGNFKYAKGFKVFFSGKKSFLKELQVLLAYIGIMSWLKMDYLYVDESFIKMFLEMIDYYDILSYYKKSIDKLPEIPGTVECEIYSIKEDKAPVYDLTMRSRSHSFHANGFVNHNTLNYGIAYGMSAQHLSIVLKISEEEAKSLLAKFMEHIPKISAWIKKVQDKAKVDGYVVNYFGRKRYLYDITKSKELTDPRARRAMYRKGLRGSVNTMIQSCGADIMKLALINCDKHLRHYGDKVKMLATIHDQILFEVANDVDPQPLMREVKNLMEIKVPEWRLNAKVSFEIANNWGDLDEVFCEVAGTVKVQAIVPKMPSKEDLMSFKAIPGKFPGKCPFEVQICGHNIPNVPSISPTEEIIPKLHRFLGNDAVIRFLGKDGEVLLESCKLTS